MQCKTTKVQSDKISIDTTTFFNEDQRELLQTSKKSFLLKNSRNKSRNLSRIKTLENAFAYFSIYDKEKDKINIWVKLILMMLRDQLWSKRSTIVKVMPQEF